MVAGRLRTGPTAALLCHCTTVSPGAIDVGFPLDGDEINIKKK